MVEYGSWAGGAFAIGIGILPAIALLAMLAVPGHERARPGVRAFVVVSGGAVVSFAWYAAIKGAYLSTSLLEPHRRAQPRLPDPTRVRRDRVPADARGGSGVGRSRLRCSRPRDGRSGCPSAAGSTTSRTTRRMGSRSSRSRTGSGGGRSVASSSRSSSSCSSRWQRSSPSAPRSGARQSGLRCRWGSRWPCSRGTSLRRSTLRSESTTSAPGSRRTSPSRTTGSTARSATPRS